jgi:hypothetical protein
MMMIAERCAAPGTSTKYCVKWLKKWLLHSVSDISPTFDLV